MRKYTRRGQIFLYKTFLFHPSFVTERESMMEESSKRRGGKRRKKAKNVHRTISCITCVGFFWQSTVQKLLLQGFFLLLGRFPPDIYRRGGKTRIGKKFPRIPRVMIQGFGIWETKCEKCRSSHTSREQTSGILTQIGVHTFLFSAHFPRPSLPPIPHLKTVKLWPKYNGGGVAVVLPPTEEKKTIAGNWLKK